MQRYRLQTLLGILFCALCVAAPVSSDASENVYKSFLASAERPDQGFALRKITLSNFFLHDPATQIDLIIHRVRIIDFLLFEEFRDVDARICILYNSLAHSSIEIYLIQIKATVLRAPDSTLYEVLAQERADQIQRCVPIQRSQRLSGRTID